MRLSPFAVLERRRKVPRLTLMARCECCGNDYEKSFDIIMNGRTHTFDSFECAIHVLAPRCAHCGCRVMGHGVEDGDKIFCCANCSRHAGVKGLVDHSGRVSLK
jgi:hypothetical protein